MKDIYSQWMEHLSLQKQLSKDKDETKPQLKSPWNQSQQLFCFIFMKYMFIGARAG